jgi:hypothetical protein
MKLKLDEINSNLCPTFICVPGNEHAGILIVITLFPISTLLHMENLGNNAIKGLFAFLCSTFFVTLHQFYRHFLPHLPN